MGQPLAQSASSDSIHVHPQSTLTPPGDDDEEPPSRHAQEIQEKVAFDKSESTSISDGGDLTTDFGRFVKTPFPFMRRRLVNDTEKQIVHDARINARRRSRFLTLFTPVHAIGPPPNYKESLRAALVYSPLNIFLVCLPVAWALHFSHQNATLVFVFSALAIIPLAALLGLGTEQIAVRTSGSVGGLLNATLGNVIELIIAGIALKKCDLALIQSSLLGGLLSNLLLVLGMAFVIGGFRFHQQEFQPMAAQLNSSLMTLSVISLLVPAAFHEWIGERLPHGHEGTVLLQLSRGSAVILILIYVAYLFFQFYSHNHLFLDTVQVTSSSRSWKTNSLPVTRTLSLPQPPAPSLPISRTLSLPQPAVSTNICDRVEFNACKETHVIPLKMNTPSAVALLLLATLLAYFTSEYLLESLNGITASHPSISREFLTLIVLPILSNAAEHATAVIVASKGKFDLAMSVAVGSCIQIALFVVPVLILVAWGIGKPLTLLFDPVETICLFFSVLMVKFSVEDGKAHWMSGVLLIGVYVLIALSFWNYPESVRILQGEPLVCK